VKKQIQKLLLGFCAFLALPTSVFAWTWGEAQQQTLSRNLVLKSVKESVDIADSAYRSARSFHLPDLSLIGSARKFEDEDGLSHRVNAGVRFRLPIYRGGRIVQGTSISRERKSQASSTYRISKVRLLRGLRNAFNEVIYIKKLIKLTSRIVEQRKENLDFVKMRYDSGLEFKWVYLSSLAKLEQARLTAINAEISEGTAIAELERITGPLPFDSVNQVDETGFYADEEVRSLDQLLPSIANHPETMVKNSELREAKFNVKLNKGLYWPTLGFQSDFQVVDTDTDPVFPFWAVSGVLSMPLFEGGRNVRKVQIAKMQVLQSQFEAQQLARNLRSRVKRAHKKYELSKKQIEVSQASYKANNDRAKVVGQRYRSGLTTFLHFERAQDDWVKAEQGLLRAKRNHQIARAQLDAEIGKELGS